MKKIAMISCIPGIILLLLAFCPGVSFSQDNMYEKEFRLFELRMQVEQNQDRLLKAIGKDDIEQIKIQSDQSIRELALLLGFDDIMVKTYQIYSDACYKACINMPAEYREKNKSIVNDSQFYRSLAQKQLQSIYPDPDIMFAIWQYGNKSFFASVPSEIDFLNFLFLSNANVYKILDMRYEYAEYLNQWRLATDELFSNESLFTHQVILSHEVKIDLSGDFALEQVVSKLQSLISNTAKYQQFQSYRHGMTIWQCRLALAYLAKGETDKGEKVIEDIRKQYDNFDPQIVNSPESMTVYYLFCKFYLETALRLQNYELALMWLEDSQIGLPLTREPQAIGHEYYYRKRAEILKHLGRDDEAKAALAEAEKIADNLEKCRVAIREAMRQSNNVTVQPR